MKLEMLRSLVAVPTVVALAFASNAALANPAADPAKAVTQTEVKKLVVPAGLSDRTMTKNDLAKLSATRNWAAVDANGDHSISPDEMEAYLKANPGPGKGK